MKWCGWGSWNGSETVHGFEVVLNMVPAKLGFHDSLWWQNKTNKKTKNWKVYFLAINHAARKTSRCGNACTHTHSHTHTNTHTDGERESERRETITLRVPEEISPHLTCNSLSLHISKVVEHCGCASSVWLTQRDESLTCNPLPPFEAAKNPTPLHRWATNWCAELILQPL